MVFDFTEDLAELEALENQRRRKAA